MRASPPAQQTASTPQAPPPPLNVNAHALFLDLDGTLVEIEERPDAVMASENLRTLLRDLTAAMDGAVALITGRTLAEADHILHGALEHVAGVHGYELQRGGEVLQEGAELSAIARAGADVRARLQRQKLPALLEDKGVSLAIHYRQAPDAGPELLSLAEEIADKHGLRVLQGKMVVELMTGARNKGVALELFMEHAPFRGRTPVKLGDDRTDEDAFAAAKALGGFGVLIGSPRESNAAYALADPSAVFHWLAAALRERAK